MKTSEDRSGKPFDLNLDALLHPAQAFEHPRDVVKDPDLTLSEKRAILSSWASDARAAEAAAALRCARDGRHVVAVDDVLDALCTLDHEDMAAGVQGAWSRRQLRRRSLEAFRQRRGRRNENPLP
jgi:hypothetical protein